MRLHPRKSHDQDECQEKMKLCVGCFPHPVPRALMSFSSALDLFSPEMDSTSSST